MARLFYIRVLQRDYSLYLKQLSDSFSFKSINMKKQILSLFIQAILFCLPVSSFSQVIDSTTTLFYIDTVAKNLDLLGTDHVRQVRKDCASVILWCAEKATWMAGEGVQIYGGNGYINEYPLGRLWRDAKLYEIGAGTSEIRRMLIGRELFAETC